MELYASEPEITNTIEMIAQENGITVAQLEESVAANGLSSEGYRESIALKLEHQKVIQTALRPRVQIDQSEVKALFQERFGDQPQGGSQVHLRQLLIPAPTSEEMGSTCTMVRDAAKRIASGEAFER